MKIFIIVLVAMCCVSGKAKPAPTDPAAAIAAVAKVIPGLGNIPGAPTGSSPTTPCASNGANTPAVGNTPAAVAAPAAGTTSDTPCAPTSAPAGTIPATPCAPTSAPAATNPPASQPAGLPSMPGLSKPADCAGAMSPINPMKTATEASGGIFGFVNVGLDFGKKMQNTAQNTIQKQAEVILGVPLPIWGR